jgi:phytoene dehydrogenase-like protein
MGNLSFIPTIPDPSQAPPGKHTFAIWFFGNHNLEGDPENWHRKADEIIDLSLDKIQAYTTNLNKDNIIGRKLYSCYDIGLDVINMEYGDQVGGETSLTQMFANRPWPGMSDYRTPIENLYQTGMTCHPAGGIHGGPGYNTAGVIAEDLDLDKWWEEED